jgi:hypothetical protein
MNAYLPAIEALKSKVEAKELEQAPLRAQLAKMDAEVRPLREMVNGLCKEAGIPPVYSLTEDLKKSEEAPKLKLRPDHFFNKELSQAAVEYLTAKKAADGSGEPTPATTSEIYEAVTRHGYSFSGTNEANNKSALKTAMTRNTVQIAKINDDLYGLRAWYGLRAKHKSRKPDDGGDQAKDHDEGAGDPPETNQGAEV